MQRWERDREAPETVSVLVQRAAEGERLREICKSRGWPYSIVAQWISDREEVAKAVEAARRIYADDLVMQTPEIADESGDGEVPKSKHRTDVRFKVASFLDRPRFGDQVQHNVTVDPFGEMLKRVSERNLARLREAQGGPARIEKDITPPVTTEHEMI
jgi:hypothetical protein